MLILTVDVQNEVQLQFKDWEMVKIWQYSEYAILYPTPAVDNFCLMPLLREDQVRRSQGCNLVM